MIELPQVTLFCLDCVDVGRSVRAVERSRAGIRFGEVQYLTSLPTHVPRVVIPHIGSLVHYSVYMLKEAFKHIHTPYVLVVQHDGFVLNPEAWDPAWLGYDYIGPLFLQKHEPDRMVGSGGFSLRSKKLMEYVASHTPEWDGRTETVDFVQTQMGAYEDGVICHRLRPELEHNGFKFAPREVACKFAQGGWPEGIDPEKDNRTFYCEKPLGFHGGWSNINYETGFVSPPPFMPGNFIL